MNGVTVDQPNGDESAGNARASSGSSIQVLHRSLGILEVLAAAEGPLSLTEISRSVGLHKSTVLRILRSLADGGYALWRPKTRTWSIGPSLARLQPGAQSRGELTSLARPVMRDLCATIGQTVQIATLVDGQICYLEKAEPQGRLPSHTVSHRPAHCTALGKVLLAGLSPAALDALLARVEIRSFTDNTITDEARLRREIAAVAVQGYAVDDREFRPATVCTAAPIRDASGNVLGGLGVSVAGMDARGAAFAAIIQRNMAAARQISSQFGWNLTSEAA
ncbi:IclR family transcriptional regulator [Afifella marina]|uniref:Transcriptional regulator, IclR family n=1 Tax=Afifella marina DSM 2698 TaxID=1120955 RepID=A0A1G5MTZ4_AFIMA|nr:IclR family transcriptional regulator [Afifella marina]SCZ28533.1 transcriptional regulator, IclR family [Afifella marina DSM 2698]